MPPYQPKDKHDPTTGHLVLSLLLVSGGFAVAVLVENAFLATLGSVACLLGLLGMLLLLIYPPE